MYMQRILFIYLFIILSVATYAQRLSKQDEQFVDSIMNANYKPIDPGAVVLIAKDGQAVYRKAYGLANLELNVQNTPDDSFAIGSMSKQFVAVCMLKLAQEGKLNLQEDITKYLPTYNTHGRHISIENLLTHTSGIIDLFDKSNFPENAMVVQSPEDLPNFFMNDSLVFEPGTYWKYSNSGYMVAGLIIEKVSGISLTEYMQQNIFIPLGMSHTYIGNNESLKANSVHSYDPSGSGKFQPNKGIDWSWTYAAGPIISNVDDLLKWDNALYTEKIIKREWLEQAWKSFTLPNGQKTNYGFGWSTNNFGNLKFIEHGGEINGFFSDGIRIPSKKLFIVMLSNRYSQWPPVSWAIALRVAGQTLMQPSTNVVDEKTLEGYTGVYAIHHVSGEQLYQYYTTKNDTLYAQSPGYSKGVLLNVSKDLFVPVYGTQYYQFHRNEKGNVISVEVYTQPIQSGPDDLNLKTDMPLPKEKQAVTLDVKELQVLQGKYDLGGGLIIPVTVEENRIYVAKPDGGKEEIFAEDKDHFFSKTTDMTVEFTKANGNITLMIIHTQGIKIEAKKVE